MSDQPRPLPGQPSLRYLKLEARRRLAAGEFGTLHDAQLAIAREHGQPSWTALKQLIESRLAQLGHPALTHLRWVISRFGGADGPDWAAPADDELSEHFTDRFLRRRSRAQDGDDAFPHRRAPARRARRHPGRPAACPRPGRRHAASRPTRRPSRRTG